jgi:nitroreductase
MTNASTVLTDAERPAFGDLLNPAHPSAETLRLLWTRRSASVRNLGEPGPSDDQTRQLLTLGTRVPDHGKLAPWRFIVFEGKARADFGDVLAAVTASSVPNAPPERLELERKRLLRAPLVICVVSSVREGSHIPEWEQILSAGAVGQTLLIAASAMGFGAQWITEWYSYDDKVRDALGLAAGERIAGMIHVGTVQQPSPERERPTLDTLVRRWQRST